MEVERPLVAAVAGEDRSLLTSATLLVLAGDAILIAGTFLPWVRSGTATRNSYASMQAAERLDVATSDVTAAVLQAWFFVPVAAALITVGLALHHVRLASVAAAATVLLTSGCALVVVRSSVPVGAGPVTCLVGSAVLAVGAALHARHHGTCVSCHPPGT